MNRKIKVGYVLAYKAPNYIRTTTLIKALESSTDIEIYKATNTKTGILRYFETLFKLVTLRLKYHPDVYILGFRGFEIFIPVRILTIGKPLVFDSFLSLYHWTVEEHKILKPNSIGAKILHAYEKFILKTSEKILTDTELLKNYLVNEFAISESKISSVFVSTDEETFRPNTKVPGKSDFEVFFYGTLLPLHGIDVILESAKILEKSPIHFTIIGGKGKILDQLKDTMQKLALENVTHIQWVDYNKLPDYINKADLCLGGPFGNTPQAKLVITGKTFQFLATGKPTVIGKIDLNAGFTDMYNCLLVEQGSPELLAQKIKWGYDNREKLTDIGIKGRDLYNEKFAVTKISPVISNIIYSLATK